MIYTVPELEQKVSEKVYAVYEVFKNFFGEDYVDLQHLPTGAMVIPTSMVSVADVPHTDINNMQIGHIRRRLIEAHFYPFILVYWPTVTITNEHNKSIEIKDLFAKVTLTMDGTIPYEYTFQLNRSTYNTDQFFYSQGYMHSHIAHIPKHNLSEFQNPCLGTGPIKDTIRTLNESNDEVIWMLFCRELALYVTVESLSGVPYNRLEEVGKFSPLVEYNSGFNAPIEEYSYDTDCAYLFDDLSKDEVKEFILYYLNHGHLQLSFMNGIFVCGMSFYDYLIDISNSFIAFFNEKHPSNSALIADLYGEGVIRKVFIQGLQFSGTTRSSERHSISEYIGSHVCWFKGRDIVLNIEESPDNNNSNIATVLNNRIAIHLLNKILRVINYRYKNEYSRQSGENSQCESEGTPTINSKVRYI